jgi:hypothetical protein
MEVQLPARHFCGRLDTSWKECYPVANQLNHTGCFRFHRIRPSEKVQEQYVCTSTLHSGNERCADNQQAGNQRLLL